jgi:hypothetical protein
MIKYNKGIGCSLSIDMGRVQKVNNHTSESTCEL